MRLQQETRDAVVLLGVSGPVSAADARVVAGAVSRALAPPPRGVVLDLLGAGPVDAALVPALAAAAPTGSWPRPRLVLCCRPGPFADRLAELGPLYEDVDDALAHVDDRAPGHRERIALTHGPTAPAVARSAVTAAARRLGLDALADDLALVVSELVTNAVRHAEPPLELEITVSDEGVTLVVHDGSADPPQPRPADSEAEGGRGMIMVDMLADETGVRPDPPGKQVWAALGLGERRPGG